MRTRRFRRGEVIFHLGDPGDALFIVTSGAIKIMLPSDTGDEAILATLRAGDVFGELALLDGAPRSATATALEPSETLILPRAQFRELLATEPAIRDALLASLAAELRRLTNHVEELHFLDITGRLASPRADGERVRPDAARRLDPAAVAAHAGRPRGDDRLHPPEREQAPRDVHRRRADPLDRDSIVVLDLDGTATNAPPGARGSRAPCGRCRAGRVEPARRLGGGASCSSVVSPERSAGAPCRSQGANNGGGDRSRMPKGPPHPLSSRSFGSPRAGYDRRSHLNDDLASTATPSALRSPQGEQDRSGRGARVRLSHGAVADAVQGSTCAATSAARSGPGAPPRNARRRSRCVRSGSTITTVTAVSSPRARTRTPTPTSLPPTSRPFRASASRPSVDPADGVVAQSRSSPALGVPVMGSRRRVGCERLGEAQPRHVAEQGREAPAGPDLDDRARPAALAERRLDRLAPGRLAFGPDVLREQARGPAPWWRRRARQRRRTGPRSGRRPPPRGHTSRRSGWRRAAAPRRAGRRPPTRRSPRAAASAWPRRRRHRGLGAGADVRFPDRPHLAGRPGRAPRSRGRPAARPTTRAPCRCRSAAPRPTGSARPA